MAECNDKKKMRIVARKLKAQLKDIEFYKRRQFQDIDVEVTDLEKLGNSNFNI